MLHHLDRRTRPVWAIAALLATLLAGCREEPTAPNARLTGSPTRDILDEPVKRLNDHFAYLWADQPYAHTPYTPTPMYSYNASGAPMQITRKAIGWYWVTIDSVFSSYEKPTRVSVVAYGSTTVGCALYRPLRYLNNFRLEVVVSCFDRVTHASADGRFSLLVVGPSSLLPRSASAYADLSSGPYHPDSVTSFTTGPDPIVISYAGTELDPDRSLTNVSFGTGSTVGTTALVTPIDDPIAYHPSGTSCPLRDWDTRAVDVQCFDGNGEKWPGFFYILQLERGRVGRRFGFAYANKPSTDRYAPAAGHSYNSSGGAITVTHTSTGHYTIEFEGLQKPDGHTENVQVTPFAGDVSAACNVVKWVNSVSGTSLHVLVECRRIPTGAYRDVKFNVMVIE